MSRLFHIPVLSVFIILIFVCSSLLSYPVYLLLRTMSEVPFHKIISHLTSICGLLIIFLYLAFNKILNRETAGYGTSPVPVYRELLKGLFSGLAIMGMLALMFLLFETHQARPDLELTIQFLIILLIKALFTGFMVALIEETLYRGALLGGVNKLSGPVSAVFFSSVLYAAVHFIRFQALPAGAEVGWYSGFTILSKSFYLFADPVILDSFLALFMFGILLSLVRLNRNNIYQCIGIHAGVVMSIKLIKKLTDYVPGNNFEILINPYDHMLGYLAAVWLAVLVIFYSIYRMKQSMSPS